MDELKQILIQLAKADEKLEEMFEREDVEMEQARAVAEEFDLAYNTVLDIARSLRG